MRPVEVIGERDLQTLRWADELGFVEAWIGEHHTAPWEPHPAPDLLIAQALTETRSIRLAPGGFLLPYHHPAELANRVAMLDHMAQGRLNFGVAASGLPSDWAMFNVDGNAGQHREMTREALDIILKLWSAEEPFDYQGKYWHVTRTGLMLETLRPHIRPFQKPHPPIGVAGVSKGSDSAACSCSALTTATTRRPGTTRCGFWRRRSCRGWRISRLSSLPLHRARNRPSRTQAQSPYLCPAAGAGTFVALPRCGRCTDRV